MNRETSKDTSSLSNDEISIEDLTNRILHSMISSPFPSQTQPTHLTTLTNNFDPRPTKRPHIVRDDRPNLNEPEFHDLDISDEELKAISVPKNRTSPQTLPLLPPIPEASNESTHDLQQTPADGMEFHYTSPGDDSYELRRKFLKRPSSEVYSTATQENFPVMNTSILSLKQLYKGQGLVELPKFTSLKLNATHRSHLVRPIPINAAQSHRPQYSIGRHSNPQQQNQFGVSQKNSAPLSSGFQNLGPKQQPFSPYVNNGGTVMAVAGSDFVVVAADTRLSFGYSIHTRYSPKIIQLTDKCVLATSGMQADMKTLHKLLQARLKIYENLHRKPISTSALSQMLSNILYYRRFFPYYTFNVLAGLDEFGQGVVYGYDAVGSTERAVYATAGTGTELIQPLFDSQIAGKNQNRPRIVLSEMETVEIVKDAINSATERDIYTGDYAEIYVINKHGIRKEECELRHD